MTTIHACRKPKRVTPGLAVLLTVLSMNLFRFLLGKARLSYLLPYYRHV